MTRGIAVRPATLDDLAAVVALRVALLREYADHPLYEHLRDDLVDRAFELYRTQLLSANEIIFLAQRDGDTIGVLRCVETMSSPLMLPERYCYVSSVYVVPAERRKGVLAAMLACAEDWCVERNIPEMRLNNSSSSRTARDAWSALGFEVVEELRRRPVRAPRKVRDTVRARAGIR